MGGTARARVLLVGESWVTHSTHQKGFDAFHTTEYVEGAGAFIEGLGALGHEVTYIRGHEVSLRFPLDVGALQRFDVIVVSDVGANTFLLGADTFTHSRVGPNRLRVLADYVGLGGGLLMIGGYLSFSGIDGRARYGASPLAAVLPVTMLPHDDRVEVPEGFEPEVVDPRHPAIAGIPTTWPTMLGYNRVMATADATVLARVGDDPLLVVGTHRDGRVAAFTSDLAPHWAPPAFLAWPAYASLWSSLVDWVGGTAATVS